MQPVICHLKSKYSRFFSVFIFCVYDSRIGQNIIYLVYKWGFYIKDLVKLTCTNIISRVCDEWKDQMTEDNVRVAEQVKELVNVRDGMDEWLLEKGEINDIINYPCTD